jgi:tetratricopeptide (TPR) repeat protein
MNTKLNRDATACPGYLQDLNAFVDGELGDEGSTSDRPDRLVQLVQHMGACAGCHDYTTALRELSQLNRDSAAGLEEELANRVDPTGLFASITGNLVEEKRQALARLFYEIGKAYVLTGNRALQESRRQSVAYTAPSRSIRGSEVEARQVLRDAEKLGAAGQHASSTTILLRRSRQLFGSQGRGASALTKGQRFLEEAIALDPALDEARIYLGFRHAVVGRPDRARIQFRKVYLTGRTPLHKLLAAQSLGRLHAEAGDYRRAIECYEEVVRSTQAIEEPGLFPSFLNLAVNYAKVGDSEKSIEGFSQLVGRFPEKRDQIRELLARKVTFQALLEQNLTLKQDLLARAPALFAA